MHKSKSRYPQKTDIDLCGIILLKNLSLLDGIDSTNHHRQIALCFHYGENKRTVEVNRNHIHAGVVITHIGACALLGSAFCDYLPP